MTIAPTALRRAGDQPTDTRPERSADARAFRPDIEGLRAVAVVAVLLYHAGLPWFRGGFVGVDVFFVISGFLITSLLVEELEGTGRLSIPGFYARRIKRLLPATMVVLLSVTVLAWLIFSPLRQTSTAGDVAASALYVSNWHFAHQAVDYLSQGQDPSPVLHFWSLAVEEQFYLVWPLLLLLTGLAVRRYRRLLRPTLLGAIAALSLTSFVYCVHLTHAEPGAAYFSSLDRAWELGVGAALGILGARLRRVPSVVALPLAWAGLAVIGVAVLTLSDATPFPGTAALLPVLGAAAVIGAGLAAGDLGPVRLLGTRPMRHVGRLSYSWYLWHWPLLVFAGAVWGHLDPAAAVLVLAVSYVPTVLTNRLVEDPFRRSRALLRHPRRAFALAGVTMSSVLAASVLLAAMVPTVPTLSAADARGAAALPPIDASPHPASVALAAVPPTTPAQLTKPRAFTPTPQQARGDLPRIYADGCQRSVASTSTAGCVYGDPHGGVTVGLLGDSHAAQWFPPLEQVALQRHWRLVVMTKSACTPASVLVFNRSLLKRPYTECSTWRRAALARLAAEHVRLVVLTGSFTNPVVQSGHTLGPAASLTATTSGLEATLRALTGAGSKVLVLRDTPRSAVDVPDCVSSAGRSLAPCATAQARALVTASTGVEQRASAEVPGATYVDLDSAVCPSTPCPPIIGNVLVYRDSEHLTRTYALTLTPLLRAAIDEALRRVG
ncbi:MAG TPA: acyltransferase family protein [Actinomycetes bacterium]|nr:acyltransferase family protein [Actinomycetes bacterium]